MDIAFVFPGQGSQSVGMLNSFNDCEIINDVIKDASDFLNKDLRSLINNGPSDELNLTTNTQPIMLAVSYAIWKKFCLNSKVKPKVMAGHSLGEYSALLASEVFNFYQAISLVKFRSEVMQSAVPVGLGSMAAIIGLDSQSVEKICQDVTDDFKNKKLDKISEFCTVELANINSNKQMVISGSNSLIDKACEIAKKSGAKRAIRLPVSAPFHCSMLKTASVELSKKLKNEEINIPKIPVISNVDVEFFKDSEGIKNGLSRQVMSSVRWYETINRFLKMGISTFVECGPGKVLSGLVKQISPETKILTMRDKNSFEEAVSYLNNSRINDG